MLAAIGENGLNTTSNLSVLALWVLGSAACDAAEIASTPARPSTKATAPARAARAPLWVTRRLQEASAASVAMADATAPHQPGIAAMGNQPVRTDSRQCVLCDSTVMVVCSPIRPADNPMAMDETLIPAGLAVSRGSANAGVGGMP